MLKSVLKAARIAQRVANEMDLSRVYLHPGEEPPNDEPVERGPRGGIYYESQGRTSAQQDGMRTIGRGDVQSVSSFSDMGYDVGMHGDITFLVDVKPGTWEESEGLNPTRAIFKGSATIQNPHAEVLAGQIDKILGFGIVPDCEYASLGMDGSISRWIDHANTPESTTIIGGMQPSEAMTPRQKRDFVRMLIFDAVIGNSDRHGNNWIVDEGADRLWAIDHGAGFFGLDRDSLGDNTAMTVAEIGFINIDEMNPEFERYLRHARENAPAILEAAKASRDPAFFNVIRNNLENLETMRLPTKYEIARDMQLFATMGDEDYGSRDEQDDF